MQFSYAISGVLGVYTQEGSYFAPPQWGVWVPADAEHEVVTSMQAEMRSLYVRRDACPWAPEQCRVLEVTPLARELIKQFCLFPADYPEGDSAEARLVAVLLDQLRMLPEVGFSLPLPRHPGLLALCNGLIAAPDQSQTLQQWARVGLLGEDADAAVPAGDGLEFSQLAAAYAAVVVAGAAGGRGECDRGGVGVWI